MGKISNRGKAIVIASGLMVGGGHGLDALGQNQNLVVENNEKTSVEAKTSNEIAVDISVLDRISKKYQKFKDSKEGKQIINYYGQQKIIENNGSELNNLIEQKKVILDDYDPLEYGDSVVKGKIDKIISKISKDIKKNPDKYGTFKADGTFQIDEKILKEVIEKETEKEFKDFIKTLPRKETFVENYMGPFLLAGGCAGLVILFALIMDGISVIWNIYSDRKEFNRKK